MPITLTTAKPDTAPQHERRRGPYARRNAGLYRAVDVPTFVAVILVPVVALYVFALVTQ